MSRIVRHILLAGGQEDMRAARAALRERWPNLWISALSPSILGRIAASQRADELILFVDPGDEVVPDESDALGDWRGINISLADFVIDARSLEVPEALGTVLHQSQQLLAREPLADLPTTRLSWQWAELGQDPRPVELITLIKLAARHVRAHPDHVLERYGLNRELFDILAALYRSPDSQPVTQAQLASQMLVTQAGMLKRLRKLDELHYITRIDDPDDGRKVSISLSSEGRTALQGLLDDFFEAEKSTINTLTHTERETLIRLLKRLMFADMLPAEDR